MKRMFHLLCLLSCLHSAPAAASTDAPVTWNYQTRGPIYASPVVHNNVLYIGSTDSTFYALNASTGAELWRYKTGNQIRSTAAVDGNVVCFESGNLLYGLTLQGSLQWRDTLCSGPVTNQYDQWDYFHSSPVVSNGVAYVGTEKGRVFGISTQTGTVVFKCQTTNANAGIRARPLVHNNKLYFGDWDGVFHAYDLATGTEVWQYNTFPDRLWQDGKPSITTSPFFFNGNVYFAGRSCILYALNAETGAKQWTFPDPDGGYWLVGGPTVCDSVLYLGSSDSRILRTLNPVTGSMLWAKTLEGRIFGTPTVDNDYVYVGTGMEPADNIGSLYILDKHTGEMKNIFILNAVEHSSPVIVNGMLYIGSANAAVYACATNALVANTNHPNTVVRENTSVALGTVTKDTTLILHLDNTGEGMDSVTITARWSGRGVKPQNAAQVDPIHCILAPRSSQQVSISVQASQLLPQSYYLVIEFISALNVDARNFSKTYSMSGSTPTTAVGADEQTPRTWSLLQNYPNPFNPTTTISFTLPTKSFVSLKIFDMLGTELATLVAEEKAAGSHTIVWNAHGVPSGMYFFRLQAGRYSETKKMVLLQ